MSKLIKELFLSEELPNYLHPFVTLTDEDTYESIETVAVNLKAAGIRSMDLMWSSKTRVGKVGKYNPYDVEEYWTRMQWVAEICKKYGMTFMMQDAAPFPTGQADGWFEKPENLDKNKLYLAERHLDIKGPDSEAAFRISSMVGALHVSDLKRGWMLPGNKLVAVIALCRKDTVFDFDSAIDLTDQVQDGILSWSVPEGLWRLFVLYETHNGHGRAYYMNLLDADSVALNIQALHEPHYQHLKDEIGKTWLGFFYDETEVGNLAGYALDAQVGTAANREGDGMELPWSKDMTDLCRKAWGENYTIYLPLLWYEDEHEYHHVRYQYMDIVSQLIQENYNGQMHKWCKERGIQYIGHNLEDENSHCRLSCGPVHYFRMQAHQDVAGIDLVGNQLMPGKDYTQSWYGCENGDGEFYHYGLAKLASSAAHIAPNKKGRSFCEVFAVYGSLAGTRLSKFILDHLMVNGINEFIPASPYMPGTDISHSNRLYTYTNRMCHLMHHTHNAVQTAVLYHAEAEWYQGDYQLFQKPARELAQNQISYNVIPADVFENQDFYQTNMSEGLTINGNRYQALIIPGTEAIPAAVADFLESAKNNGFPVFFCDQLPNTIAETGEHYAATYGECVPTLLLATKVKDAIHCDLKIDRSVPDLRYARLDEVQGTYYFLHNEGKPVDFKLWIPYTGTAYHIDLERLQADKLAVDPENTGMWMTLELAEYESFLLYVGELDDLSVKEVTEYNRQPLDATWKVSLENGDTLELSELVNLNGASYYPAYTDWITYECDVNWDTPPKMLDLGRVYEICQVFINDKLTGEIQSSPYRISVEGLAVSGNNHIKIRVKPNFARNNAHIYAGSFDAATYNSLDPGGMLGPVTIWV